MKILYLSCHAILEYDECSMFSDLGYQVFSFNGAYQYPHGDEGRKRPGIPNMHFDDPHALEVALQCSRENIHPELLEMFDVIIVMHRDDWLHANWEKIKHWKASASNRRVILRTIGQNTCHNEKSISALRNDGLEIVRYSPTEERIPGYVGADAVIRFGKDPNIYGGYVGCIPHAINFTQSMEQRGTHCGWSEVKQIAERVSFKLLGPGNENCTFAAGSTSYEDQIRAMQNAAVYLCPGTHPASYTLNFIEAWMTGIPVVAFGPKLGSPRRSGYAQDTYEVPELIDSGFNGFYGDSIEYLCETLNGCIESMDLAKVTGNNGRKKAIELFGIDTIRAQWKAYLEQ